jgi:hypothetical protein
MVVSDCPSGLGRQISALFPERERDFECHIWEKIFLLFVPYDPWTFLSFDVDVCWYYLIMW